MWVLLWRFRDGVFEGLRAVIRHRGSSDVPITCSDDSGYGNRYDIPVSVI
ncbi:MAG: hypothetical protein ACUVWS_14005 [Roseiflexus sp.]